MLLAVVVLGPGLAGCLRGSEPFPGPDFAIVDTDGAPHNLSAYAGRVLILDLMATWCVPCQAEMGHLREVRAAYPESEVAILSVGTDPSESDAQLEDFRDRFGGTWPFARDTDGVSRKYELGIIPKLIVIDPQGRVVFENAGETYPAAIGQAIREARGEGGFALEVPDVSPWVAFAALLGAAAPFSPYLVPRMILVRDELERADPSDRRRYLAALTAGIVLWGAALVAASQLLSGLVSTRLKGLLLVGGIMALLGGYWIASARFGRSPRPDPAPNVRSWRGAAGALSFGLDHYYHAAPFWIPAIVWSLSAVSFVAGLVPIALFFGAFLPALAYLWRSVLRKSGAGAFAEAKPRSWERWTGYLLMLAGVVVLALQVGVGSP